jgi:aromatic-L-amino-acid decarboxylase
MERVEGLPVLARVKPGDVLAALPEHPPEEGIKGSGQAGIGHDEGAAGGWDAVFDDLERIVLPGLTHWQSPNFYAYFPCNASGPAILILGEFLSAGLNVNGMLWATSPAATELETRVMDWMAEMIGLPGDFRSTGANGGGCIQGTASESTLIAMVAARARALRADETTVPRTDIAAGEAMKDEGERRAALSVAQDLVAYASTQAHSSVIKAAMIAGLARSPEDRAHLRLIDTDESYAMRPDLLGAAMREDLAAGRTPFFVCATVGTTSSTAVDPVDRIAGAIAAACGGGAGRRPAPQAPWLHVDAAHAGCACVCPEFRWMLTGAERADSVCFNPHKWLLTNFDCDCFFTRDRRSLVSALSISPEYLRNAASDDG